MEKKKKQAAVRDKQSTAKLIAETARHV